MLKDLGINEMNTLDSATALSMIIEQVIQMNAGFLYRYQALVFQSSDVPTVAQVCELESMIQKELADCAGLDSMLSSNWDQ